MNEEERPESRPACWKPTSITFSSGGINGTAMNGVLASLIDADMAKHITDWYGCSCGVFAAISGALGVSSSWLRDSAKYIDFTGLTVLDEMCIDSFVQNWGLVSHQRVVTFFGSVGDTWEPGFSSMTFADLAARRPGVRLHIVATNVSKCVQEVFNVYTTPTMRVMDAVGASCAIPFYFTPWISPSGDYYCDGAVSEYYAWDCISDKANTLVVAGYDSCLSGPGHAVPLKSVNSFIFNIGTIIQKNKSSVRPLHWIALNITGVDGMDFALPEPDRVALFNQGYRVAKNWIKCVASESPGSPAVSAGHHTESSLAHSQNKMSGTPSRRTSPPHPFPDQHPRIRSAPCRRWSL